MDRLFLSYRRADTDYALLLYEFLKQRFGRERIFLDTVFIEPGQDFVATLERELASCAAFVALIGRGWIDSRARLDEPDDYVRLEIATVLQREILLVPILAGGAKMPKGEEMPAPLAQLSRTSALEIRVDSDLELLTRVLERKLPIRVTEPPPLDASQRNVLEILKRQAQRLQVRAVELIEQGQTDRAVDELNEGMDVIQCLQQWGPPDIGLDLYLAYIYKTFAQTFEAERKPALVAEYQQLAVSVFERIGAAGAQGRYTPDQRASALNGMGAIYYQRGELDRAIESYRAALAIEPGYAYAWHDLFGALAAQAQRGQVDLEGMREALAQAKRLGEGQPGLSAQYLEQLQRYLRPFEPPPVPPRRRPRKRR
jgi:tetratricopeptide (TPR) repeat protein